MVKTTHQCVLTDEYIVEAQRLAIAQNKTLKFLYQTWWAWWLPRVVLAGILIFSLLNDLEFVSIMIGAILLMSVGGEWFGRRNLAKARKKMRFKGSTTTVSMDENGVDIVGETGNSHSKWSGMLVPAIYPHGVVIKFSRFAMVWLPDQALVEGSAADVRALLARERQRFRDQELLDTALSYSEASGHDRQKRVETSRMLTLPGNWTAVPVRRSFQLTH